MSTHTQCQPTPNISAKDTQHHCPPTHPTQYKSQRQASRIAGLCQSISAARKLSSGLFAGHRRAYHLDLSPRYRWPYRGAIGGLSGGYRGAYRGRIAVSYTHLRAHETEADL
eukprot:1422527-Rhodomonas_salina.3